MAEDPICDHLKDKKNKLNFARLQKCNNVVFKFKI
jgi:hypothetical protein